MSGKLLKECADEGMFISLTTKLELECVMRSVLINYCAHFVAIIRLSTLRRDLY